MSVKLWSNKSTEKRISIQHEIWNHISKLRFTSGAKAIKLHVKKAKESFDELEKLYLRNNK